MAGLKEIAASTGVCVRTVSQVLNGRYQGRTERSRHIMQLVQKEAEKLNYRPNNAARAMRTQSTGLIGVVCEKNSLMTHPVFTETLQGIHESLTEAGYVLTVTSLAGLEEGTLESRIFTEHLLDGIIVVDNVPEEKLGRMRDILPNCVMLNTNTWLPYCCVRRNEFEAGRRAAIELAALGYKKAFYFDIFPVEGGGPEEAHYSEMDRLTGFTSAFEEKGVKIEILRMQPFEIGDFIAKNINLIDPRSAFVAAHNLRMFSLVSALAKLPLRAGFDFGLASLDDEAGLLASFPDLSRISFPRVEIGRKAGKMIKNLIQGKIEKCRSVEVSGEWISGDTTKIQV